MTWGKKIYYIYDVICQMCAWQNAGKNLTDQNNMRKVLDKRSHVWSFQIWSCFNTGKIRVAFIIFATATALHICILE